MIFSLFRPANFARPTKLVAITAISALGLSACTTTADIQALREAPGYHSGYADGCSTATEEDKSFSTDKTRDAYAFKNDEAYRMGWRQGYLECSHTTPVPSDGGRILGERNEY
ncbi:hypothetical protein [Hyphococcus sp. DH-69]|uniref:hypothetical protein n=1 Tax=Hyphococcus formosus TaxID=3143534 RepID=UPI00398B1916